MMGAVFHIQTGTHMRTIQFQAADILRTNQFQRIALCRMHQPQAPGQLMFTIDGQLYRAPGIDQSLVESSSDHILKSLVLKRVIDGQYEGVQCAAPQAKRSPSYADQRRTDAEMICV